jgi:hypothetical protein
MAELQANAQAQSENYDMRVDYFGVLGMVGFTLTHKHLVGISHVMYVPINAVFKVAGVALSAIDAGQVLKAPTIEG